MQQAPVPILTWDAWLGDAAGRPADPARWLPALTTVRELLERLAMLAFDGGVELRTGLDQLCHERAAELAADRRALAVVTTSGDALIGQADAAAIARLLDRTPAELERTRGEVVTVAGYHDADAGLRLLFAVGAPGLPALVVTPGPVVLHGPLPAAGARQDDEASERAVAAVVAALRRGHVEAVGPVLADLDRRLTAAPPAVAGHHAATFGDRLVAALVAAGLAPPHDVLRAVLPPRLYDAVAAADWRAGERDRRW